MFLGNGFLSLVINQTRQERWMIINGNDALNFGSFDVYLHKADSIAQKCWRPILQSSHRQEETLGTLQIETFSDGKCAFKLPVLQKHFIKSSCFLTVVQTKLKEGQEPLSYEENGDRKEQKNAVGEQIFSPRFHCFRHGPFPRVWLMPNR